MSKGIDAFERFWREMDLSPRSTYIHPKDEQYLDPTQHSQFHFEVLPIPVLGNLRSAEAVILMLNAGYGDNDEAWNRMWPGEHTAMKDAQKANLLQQHGPDDYPFYDFNPRFRTHPGAAYWRDGAELAVKQRKQAKLKAVAQELGNHWNKTREEVHKILSYKVAVLEWCPYRSKNFKRTSGLAKIPSVLAARELVRSLMHEGEKLVIATRHIDAWGYSGSADSKVNLIVYDGRQGTSASLTLNSAGGKALARRLLDSKL